MEITKLKQVIEQELRPIMVDIFYRMVVEGPNLKMDGVAVYNDKAQFVGGKVINFGSYTALEFLKTKESLERLRNLIQMVYQMPMETWGILNGITGLYRLKQAGKLDFVVDQETLETLKKSMDWRTFVDVDNKYELIKKPTNYYGVAFGIARYRELLGWETEEHSYRLLERLLEHIDQYSGDLGYMDETPGDGRFDRYSALVPGEVTALILGTGWSVPRKIREMLKKSVHIFLQLSNSKGWGFAYGRSIGPYGDTAALEVLSSAVRLGGVLTKKETELAYGYCIKLAEHICRYWYDAEIKSINMWNKGRRTDNYRNKNRILGENLSLCMQVINCYEHWVNAGFENQDICADFERKLSALVPYTMVKFAKGEYERGLAIIRDGAHVWSLPLINGGRGGYFDKDAYMPVPFQNEVLQGVPEHSNRQMVPQLVMENGDVYMPISWIKAIETTIADQSLSIVYSMDTMCRLGGRIPEKAKGIGVTTRYTFVNHQICREDIFRVEPGHNPKEVRLVFLTFSTDVEMKNNEILFGRGVVYKIQAEGYEHCEVTGVDKEETYDTPCGRLKHVVQWTKQEIPENGEICVRWVLSYRE